MITNPLTFDYSLFIAQFSAYSDSTKYPQSVLQGYWDVSIDYISNAAFCGSLTGAKRQYALNLLVAHFAYINDAIAKGESLGFATSASVDKVSVSIAAPRNRNEWEFWLNGSPYGQQLLALLQVASAGGFYIGGASALSGFRFGQRGRYWGCC